MKKLVLLTLLVLVIMTMGVSAVDIYVDDSGGADYLTIQAAINAATAGDIIYVAAGTYVEQIKINKDLVLQGGPGVIIQSPVSRTTYTIPESGSTLDPIIFVFGGTEVAGVVSGPEVVEVELRDIEIDGQDNFIAGRRYYGVLARNADLIVDNLNVHNLGIDGVETFGIVVYGDSDCVISDSAITDFSRGGIGILGDGNTAPDPVCEVTGNIVTGPGLGVLVTWAPNGIQVSYGASANIDGNEVSACGWPGTAWSGTCILAGDTSDVVINNNYVHDCEQAISVGDYPSSWGGIFATLTASDMVISNNLIEDNEWGISVFNDISNVDILYNDILSTINDGIDVYNYGYGGDNSPTDVVIKFNNIVGNGLDGLWIGDDVDTVDATLNWWGSQDGPSGDGLGSGDTIVGNAIYQEWLCEEAYTTWHSQNGVCTYPNPGVEVDMGFDFDIILENSCPEINHDSIKYFVHTWMDEEPEATLGLGSGVGYEDLLDIAFAAGWAGRSYAFDGELITFKFNATVPNGATTDCTQGFVTLEDDVDPRVVQCVKTIVSPETIEFMCAYYVEDAATRMGEYWVSVEIGSTCDDYCDDSAPSQLHLYLNPAVGLSMKLQGEPEKGFTFSYDNGGDVLARIVNGQYVEGAMPGDSAYTPYFVIENAADAQTGLYMLMQMYGTDFRATPNTVALCPTSNRLEIDNMWYEASHLNAHQPWTRMPDGTNNGALGSDYIFNIWSGPNFNGAANFLGVGDDLTLRLRLDIPSPCIGEFTLGGDVIFVGQVI